MSHCFSGSPKTERRRALWQSAASRLTGIGITLVSISHWPDPGPLALSSKGWLWQMETWENPRHTTPPAGWKLGLRTPTETEEMRHKAFCNSSQPRRRQ